MGFRRSCAAPGLLCQEVRPTAPYLWWPPRVQSAADFDRAVSSHRRPTWTRADARRIGATLGPQWPLQVYKTGVRGPQSLPQMKDNAGAEYAMPGS